MIMLLVTLLVVFVLCSIIYIAEEDLDERDCH